MKYICPRAKECHEEDGITCFHENEHEQYRDCKTPYFVCPKCIPVKRKRGKKR